MERTTEAAMPILDKDLSGLIPNGWRFGWRADVAAGRRVHITLKDSKTVFYDQTSTQIQHHPLGPTGYAIAGDKLSLTIDVENSPDAQVDDDSHVVVNPKDPKRKPIASSYTAFVEDWVDQDFNDVVVSVFGTQGGE